MKTILNLTVAVVLATGSAAFAQPAPDRSGIKIVKITGTVNIMKDGRILMTLKPGDSIPAIEDNKVSFSVVEGTIEVGANGKTITAATGSNFTVATTNGQMNVAVTAGTPVAVKTPSGHNVVVTANSEVKMTTVDGKMDVKVEKGAAVMTDAAGGNTQTLKAGETAAVSAPRPASESAVKKTPAPAPAGETVPPPPPPPASSVIETQVVQQSVELSASNP